VIVLDHPLSCGPGRPEEMMEAVEELTATSDVPGVELCALELIVRLIVSLDRAAAWGRRSLPGNGPGPQSSSDEVVY
jgi:hypothetical protein